MVHDIGGPIGFELAAKVPHRVASMTILNTMVEGDTIRQLWTAATVVLRSSSSCWL